MVYVWTGLTQAIGLKYYAIPGIDIPPDVGFQYIEPPEEQAFMRADEYDELIDDPTGFLYNVWLPRVSTDVSADRRSRPPIATTCRFVKGGMAMLQLLQRVRARRSRGCGTSPARSPPSPASSRRRSTSSPTSCAATSGLTMDMLTQPEKVLAACEALMPHLLHVALSHGRPERATCPSASGCTAAACRSSRRSSSRRTTGPRCKPIIEELWKHGHQTLFYAEGKWNAPPGSTSPNCPTGASSTTATRTTSSRSTSKLDHKFCLSGGIPNDLLSYGTPDEVRACCRR